MRRLREASAAKAAVAPRSLGALRMIRLARNRPFGHWLPQRNGPVRAQGRTAHLRPVQLAQSCFELPPSLVADLSAATDGGRQFRCGQLALVQLYPARSERRGEL